MFAHSGHDQGKPQILAPGYRPLQFEAPTPGTYSLPDLGAAGDGRILDTQGKTTRLHNFLGDKFVILSFIYTHCDDINGCPLATYVSSQVQNRLLDYPALKDKVRFVSLSFDPVNDTPRVMAEYGKNFTREDFDWKFLTTAAEKDLDPLLAAYDQSILRAKDAAGNATGSISHILRVFLIDRQKRIRNIYSTSFLHPQTVINDLLTLTGETFSGNPEVDSFPGHNLHGAGDARDGYENRTYSTRARSLEQRKGMRADLLQFAKNPPTGLPAYDSHTIEQTTRTRVELGRRLFYDRRLSHNNTFSCAMCHIPEQGFSSNELATAVGIEGRTVRRNAPSLYNVAHAALLFHDGRESSLERQIWAPLLARNEMANPSMGFLIDKINALDEYREDFKRAFSGQPANIRNLGQALAAYQRTLVSANSGFDRWYFGGEKQTLDPAAVAGFKLFTGKAGCSACHLVGERHALFSDNRLHNTGVGYRRSMSKTPASRRIMVAPGTWLEVDNSAIRDSAETPPNDLGYYEISGDPADRWKYKTPTLRNIALSPPYMHDGSISSLRGVIEFYDRGGVKNELLDPLIRPLGLSDKEKKQLVEFLLNLTGDNIDTIVSDAFAAPVGNTQ